MRILIYLGHPAHFYNYKNVIPKLMGDGHQVEILIKKKDVLEDLLEEAGLPYHNILKEGRKDSKLGILWGTLKRAWRLYSFCRKFKPDILTGTSVENSWVGKLRHIPVININEDDAAVVPKYARLSYPWATEILTPAVCDNGKWNKKSIKYDSYHELAYLHPHNFIPDRSIVEKYFPADTPYFLIRFAKLKAHHDTGIKGIDTDIARRLIDILKPHGRVFISSERALEPEFEPYRIHIKPIDMHHVMAFADLYLGDSQTMAAEAGVLGLPFIRFNDFVGKIGYLRELEDIYQLGYGIKTDRARTSHPSYSLCDKIILSCKYNIEASGSSRSIRKFSTFARSFISKATGIPLNKFNYKDIRSKLIIPDFREENVLPVLFPNWDNTPRREAGALILHEATPEQFYLHCKDVFSLIKEKRDKTVFLKSWNEWGEGNYMEPCLKYEHGYIESLDKALQEFNER